MRGAKSIVGVAFFIFLRSSLTGASATLKLFAVNRFISFIDV
jgi:hypothetical protein